MSIYKGCGEGKSRKFESLVLKIEFQTNFNQICIWIQSLIFAFSILLQFFLHHNLLNWIFNPLSQESIVFVCLFDFYYY